MKRNHIEKLRISIYFLSLFHTVKMKYVLATLHKKEFYFVTPA